MVDAREGPKRRVARDRNKPLQAYVTPDERKAIEDNAAAAGLTVSAFLRVAAMGLKTQSAPALEAIATLAKVNADQARLGNLMKLYLQDPNADQQTALRILDGIDDVKAELIAAAKRIRA